jgi:hypothetical protein
VLDRDAESEVLDEEALKALADKTVGAILKESARLPEREKRIILGIVRRFSDQLGAAERWCPPHRHVVSECNGSANAPLRCGSPLRLARSRT